MYAKPEYRVVILQLVWYLRIGCNCQGFAYRSELLITRLLRQGYVCLKPCSTYKTFANQRILLLSALSYLQFNTAWHMQLPYLTWHIYLYTHSLQHPCTFAHAFVQRWQLWSLQSLDLCQTKDSCTKRQYFQGAATGLLDKASYLTTFCTWNNSLHLPITECSTADEA